MAPDRSGRKAGAVSEAAAESSSGAGEREDLRERIIEAARDIVSEEGLDALSMRALGLRIGYSPASIYLYFRDKDELLRSVMTEGFSRLAATMDRELRTQPEGTPALERYAATGRAYARFALENTGYFRAMFKMPRVAQLEGCPEPVESRQGSKDHAMCLIQEAIGAGEMATDDPEHAALLGWGMVHGLTSLYLSGHLSDRVNTPEEFMELIEAAIEVLGLGWKPR